MKTGTVGFFAFVCSTLFACTISVKYSCQQYRDWNLPNFPCRSGDECVFKYYECDSILDCADNSDEDHCTEQHRENCKNDFKDKKTEDGSPLQSFQCQSGMCILGCRQCDGFPDCPDSSDEVGCTAEVQMSVPPCQ